MKREFMTQLVLQPGDLCIFLELRIVPLGFFLNRNLCKVHIDSKKIKTNRLKSHTTWKSKK